jgi:hypothetical protein
MPDLCLARTSSVILLGDGQEQLELWGKLLLGVQTVREVYSADATVGVDLHPQGLNVVGTVGSSSEIRQIELNLVPALVQSHGHSTDEGLHTRRGLVVGGSESSTDVLIIQHHNLESEIFAELQIVNGI